MAIIIQTAHQINNKNHNYHNLIINHKHIQKVIVYLG